MIQGKSYDFIYVGGGHNCLTSAAYMAKADQKVIVLEKRDIIGGGVMTEELTLPGFKHNPHSNSHMWIFMGPVYYDLELKKYGAVYRYTPPFASVFEDGRCLILYRDIDRTVKQIEKFSLKDARTYKEMAEIWVKNIDFLVTSYIFSPPMSFGKMFTLFEGTHEGREFLRMFMTSMEHLIEELFENDRVKAWLLLMGSQVGMPHDMFGSGSFFTPMFPALHRAGAGICVGGVINLAKAMVKFIEEHGGVVRLNHEVKRIKVNNNGIATGVELTDGGEIIAKKAVVTNLISPLVFGDKGLVDHAHLDENFLQQVRRWRPGKVNLFSGHYAFDESPLYKASEKEPDLQKVFMVGICEHSSVLTRQFNAGRVGELPRGDAIGFIVLDASVTDAKQAPPGKHNPLLWHHATYEISAEGGAKKWDEIKEDFNDECLKVWGKHAPNVLKKGTILGQCLETPLDLERRNPNFFKGDVMGGELGLDQQLIFRPFHGYPPYKTPIENLYMCGPSCHPGGGASGAPGYNATNIIAEDLKIKKWWKTPAYFGGAAGPEE